MINVLLFFILLPYFGCYIAFKLEESKSKYPKYRYINRVNIKNKKSYDLSIFLANGQIEKITWEEYFSQNAKKGGVLVK